MGSKQISAQKFYSALIILSLTGLAISITVTPETIQKVAQEDSIYQESGLKNSLAELQKSEISTTNLQKGLQGHYRFDDLGVSKGKTLEFDGVDDGVTISWNPEDNENFSYSAWFKPYNTSGGQIIGNNPGCWTSANLYVESGEARFGIRQGDGGTCPATVTQSITEGKWYHAVGVADASSGEIKLYLDGELVGTDSNWNGSFVGSVNALGIDEYSGPEHAFNGAIADPRIYERKLSSSEVTRLYNEKSISHEKLVLHQRFNENPSTCNLTSGKSCLEDETLEGTNATPRNFEDNNWGTGSGWLNNTPLNKPKISDYSSNSREGTFLGANNGNLNNFYFNSTNGWTDGKIGQNALKFSGGNEYVDLDGSGEIRQSLNQAPFAVDFWIKPNSTTATGWPEYMRFSSTSARIEIKDPQYDWGGIDTMAVFWYNETGGKIFDGGTSSLNPKKWNHVLFQYDRDTFELYINGNLESSKSVSDPVENVGDSIVLDGSNINWSIDGLSFYNTTFTDSGVSELYNLREIKKEQKYGEWNFDEGNRETTYDTSGFDKSGVLGTSSIRFDGNSEYISIGDIGQTMNKSNQFTISYWIRYDELVDYRVPYGSQFYYDGSESKFWTEPYRDGFQGVSINVPGVNGSIHQFNSERVISDRDTWHHISYTWDGSTMKAYLKGKKIEEWESEMRLNLPQRHFIGSYDGGSNVVNGKMDEVRLYNRSLSTQEIRRLAFQ